MVQFRVRVEYSATGVRRRAGAKVHRKDASTLLRLVTKYIRPGTTIISDSCRAYRQIAVLSQVYVHQLNFVDPATRAHTQKIECHWQKFKTLAKRKYVTLEDENMELEVNIPECARRFTVADFTLDQVCLALVHGENVRKVVTPSERREVFNDAHVGLLAGHFGSKKLLAMLSMRVFWETMSSDVTKWIRECRSWAITTGKQ
ncbi:hypothetical protein Q1695_011986 [Nippostrongylus brasiliensis]|nr:hypothetical protein Q1695_011986 [Nippostrongylus brasiliensis]